MATLISAHEKIRMYHAGFSEGLHVERDWYRSAYNCATEGSQAQ